MTFWHVLIPRCRRSRTLALATAVASILVSPRLGGATESCTFHVVNRGPQMLVQLYIAPRNSEVTRQRAGVAYRLVEARPPSATAMTAETVTREVKSL